LFSDRWNAVSTVATALAAADEQADYISGGGSAIAGPSLITIMLLRQCSVCCEVLELA